MSKESREITSVDQLIPGKTYFLAQDDFVGYGEFLETKPPKKLAEGPNVFVPNSEPLACFYPLTVCCRTRYKLFEKLKEQNIRIYESKEHENEFKKS